VLLRGSVELHSLFTVIPPHMGGERFLVFVGSATVLAADPDVGHEGVEGRGALIQAAGDHRLVPGPAQGLQPLSLVVPEHTVAFGRLQLQGEAWSERGR
jgi:hypothetical protein